MFVVPSTSHKPTVDFHSPPSFLSRIPLLPSLLVADLVLPVDCHFAASSHDDPLRIRSNMSRMEIEKHQKYKQEEKTTWIMIDAARKIWRENIKFLHWETKKDPFVFILELKQLKGGSENGEEWIYLESITRMEKLETSRLKEKDNRKIRGSEKMK